MFSRFKDGIKDTKNSILIGFPELKQIIRNNPNKNKIEQIRNLRKNGDDYYKTLKSGLPYITPNCMVKQRNLDPDHFDQNFIQFSQYLYYDIDKLNPEEYKNYFIKRYGHLASMVCISSSGGGISVLFKVKNIINKENFGEIWTKLRTTILDGEPIDEKCKDIGRAMFISYDPDLFYNDENEVEVEVEVDLPNNINPSNKKGGKQSKPYNDFNNTLTSPISIISVNELLQKIITRTIVEVSNPIVDFKPVECVEVFIPKFIHDGTKHIIFTSMIHHLVHLNPDLEEKYLFSYLFYINNRFARPKMERKELIRLFNMVYKGINESGKTIVKKEIQYVHFNSSCSLPKKEKSRIANILNGCKRKNQSIKKIQDAKYELERKGQKTIQRNIAKISGLSPKTVRNHLNSQIINMEEMVAKENNSVPTKSVLG
jgi:hypothetical protein